MSRSPHSRSSVPHHFPVQMRPDYHQHKHEDYPWGPLQYPWELTPHITEYHRPHHPAFRAPHSRNPVPRASHYQNRNPPSVGPSSLVGPDSLPTRKLKKENNSRGSELWSEAWLILIYGSYNVYHLEKKNHKLPLADHLKLSSWLINKATQYAPTCATDVCGLLQSDAVKDTQRVRLVVFSLNYIQDKEKMWQFGDAIVKAIEIAKEMYPLAKIALLSELPPAPDNVLFGKSRSKQTTTEDIMNFNSTLTGIAWLQDVHYIDCFTRFLTRSGTQCTRLYSGTGNHPTHISNHGLQVITRAITEFIQLIGEIRFNKICKVITHIIEF